MLEQETEQIIATIRQRTLEGRPAVALKDVLAADIPSAVKVFFRTDVETILMDEQRKYFKSTGFPYDHPDVQSVLKQMNSLLVLEYRFEPDALNQRITDGVHLLMNYLVRPQWTLTESLFERDHTIPAAALRRLLAYFEPYEYLRSLLLLYLKEKNIESIDRRQFADILWKVDGEYLRRRTGEEIVRLMVPMFDVLAFSGRVPTGACPTRAIIRFFEDKGLHSVLPMLEGNYAQGKETMNGRELVELLEDIRGSGGAFIVEPHEHLAPEPPAPAPIAEPDTTVPATANSERVEIDASEERRFIRKIFQHDAQAYADALVSITRCSSWKEASRAIDEIFIARTIDPYSSEAIRFTEALFDHFHHQDRR